MVDDCAVCGESGELLRDCKYCTGVYCPDHALPESHDCPGVAEIEDRDEWFRDRETNVPTYRGEEVRPRPEPLTSDEVTTYGSVEADFESSPDVAVDGSIVRDDETDSDAQSNDGHGLLTRVVTALKFWS